MEITIEIENYKNYDKDSLEKALDVYINNIPYILSNLCKVKDSYKFNKVPVMGELKGYDVDKGIIKIRFLYDDYKTYDDTKAILNVTGQTINGNVNLNRIYMILLEKRY